MARSRTPHLTWQEVQLPSLARDTVRMQVTVFLDPTGWSVTGFSLTDPVSDAVLALEAFTTRPAATLAGALSQCATKLQKAGEAHCEPFG